MTTRRHTAVLCLVGVSMLWIAGGVMAQNVQEGLIAYYPLNEGSGETAHDQSGFGPALDLTLLGGAQWLPGGGVAFDGVADGDPARMQSSGAATKLHERITTTGRFTVAVWARAGVQGQAGPARIVSYSLDGSNRNFTLGHGSSGAAGSQPPDLAFRLRTTGTGDNNGLPQMTVPNAMSLSPQHYAATYDGTTVRIYHNGLLVLTEARNGELTNWNATYPLNVGAEANLDRPWHGEVFQVAIYDRDLSEPEIEAVMLGAGELASAPSPEDGATDVPRDVTVSWTAGEFAATHDVYFGMVLDDVNDASRSNPMGVLVSQGQTETTYDLPGMLDFGTTYYWRIDEVNAPPDSTIFKGNVWSFTTEPVAYVLENIVATSNGISEATAGPEKTIDGSGLDADDRHSVNASDMWLADPPADGDLYMEYAFDRVYKLHEMLVWNYNVQFEMVLGFGLKDVTVEYSVDGEEWAVLGDVEFARATARADYVANTVVDFEGVAAKFVRLTVNSGWGLMGQFGLSEVRFLYVPAPAREPQPADGAMDVDPETALSWRAGRNATSHDVYLGTDAEALPLVESVTAASLTVDDLSFGTMYYWQVDAVSDELWAGDLWSFATLEFRLIDGFESYTDDIDAGEAIFDTWLDGWANETGSTVGYLHAPFAERTIVRSGAQSMPLLYDNTTAPFYSEAERTFDSPQNWTGNGADTLRLFVAGQAPAFVETADGTILMNAIGNDIWGNADQFRYAYRTLTGNGSVTARVDDMDLSPDVWVKGGVMIRQNAEAGAINTFMAITGSGGGGATYQQRMTAGGESVSQHTYADGPFAPPYWVRVERQGNTLTGYTSPDGQTWTQRGDTVTLAMNDPVLIGLALTSHNVNQATSAQFSNASFTGNVSGTWQVAEVGVAQPEGNDVAPLYVALEDATGKSAVVTHPDANIVGRSGWNEWQIPLSDFSGVNLGRVDTMTIGVGNRTSPTAGDAGTIYIDDIAFGKPAMAQ